MEPIPDRLYTDPQWALGHYTPGSPLWRAAKQVANSMESAAAQSRSLAPLPRRDKPAAQQSTARYGYSSAHIFDDSAIRVPVKNLPARVASLLVPASSSRQPAPITTPSPKLSRNDIIDRDSRPDWIINSLHVSRLNDYRDLCEIIPNAAILGSKTMLCTKDDFQQTASGFWPDTYRLTFKPPSGTIGIPQTENDELTIIFCLGEAILNKDGVHDNPRAAFMVHWSSDSTTAFERWQVDPIARKILDACIKLHKDGFREPIFDRALETKVNPNLAFNERINCLIVLFSKWKSVCDTIMRSEKIMTYVAGPAAHYKITHAAQKQNETRKNNYEQSKAERYDLEVVRRGDGAEPYVCPVGPSASADRSSEPAELPSVPIPAPAERVTATTWTHTRASLLPLPADPPATSPVIYTITPPAPHSGGPISKRTRKSLDAKIRRLDKNNKVTGRSFATPGNKVTKPAPRSKKGAKPNVQFLDSPIVVSSLPRAESSGSVPDVTPAPTPVPSPTLDTFGGPVYSANDALANAVPSPALPPVGVFGVTEVLPAQTLSNEARPANKIDASSASNTSAKEGLSRRPGVLPWELKKEREAEEAKEKDKDKDKDKDKEEEDKDEDQVDAEG
ncbi:hypothetical protein K458DRAFT_491898 [Lentithecium fluviatile CBS 122367]|uniref:Uncharacterized protein n=1 Tax=Lentithecium fluviatile CBS 122367 TaxID=1168545 RepID=A0A6G1IGH0_9PLEO|nr:hypothetical protein K458DRAFT_491898 [Lentithecium fluviatile CBS 122367]